MLTVHRQQGGTTLLHRLHKEAARAHQRLLIGQQDGLSRPGGTQRRPQSGKSDDPRNDRVNVRCRHQFVQHGRARRDGDLGYILECSL